MSSSKDKNATPSAMPSSKPVDPYQKQACQIQACLQDNKYQESKCEAYIKMMWQCCEKYRDQSNCCAGFKS